MEQVLRTLATWTIIFFIYSCAGWLLELIATLIQHHKIYNRGFLIGPLCPIYGCGAVLGTLFFGWVENPVLIFILCALSAGALEYFTSFWMEKLFRARWWDYSWLPFNIHGRTCLTAMLSFGLVGIMVIKVLNPIFLEFMQGLSTQFLVMVALALVIVFIIDTIWSFTLIFHFRLVAKEANYDATEEISSYVREALMHRTKMDKRLIDAFPNLEVQKTPPKKSKKLDR